MPKALNLINEIFDTFKVIEKLPSKNKKTYWLCECQNCKNKKEIQTTHLRNNTYKKCECQENKVLYSEKICILCQTSFIPNNPNRKYCYECSPEGVSAAESLRRKKRSLKHYLITLKGGKCQKCGYDKCEGSLQFHHRNPVEKEFNFSHINLNDSNFSLNILLLELEKCDLLCANCHSEHHYLKDE